MADAEDNEPPVEQGGGDSTSWRHTELQTDRYQHQRKDEQEMMEILAIITRIL